MAAQQGATTAQDASLQTAAVGQGAAASTGGGSVSAAASPRAAGAASVRGFDAAAAATLSTPAPSRAPGHGGSGMPSDRPENAWLQPAAGAPQVRAGALFVLYTLRVWEGLVQLRTARSQKWILTAPDRQGNSWLQPAACASDLRTSAQRIN